MAGFFTDDDETIALIMQLQLQDLEELISTSHAKGKGREGAMTDLQLAYQTEKEELERGVMLITDRKMTQSIARAVVADADLLASSAAQEAIASEDRAMSLRLGGVGAQLPAPALLVGPKIEGSIDPDFIDKLFALYVKPPSEDGCVDNDIATELADLDFGVDFDGNSAAEFSSWALTRQDTRRISRRRCVICMEDVIFYDVAHLACGHDCCRDCLVDIFKAATVNEDRYPPKCCAPILIEPNIKIFLNEEIVQRFEEKKIEWEAEDRIYCANLECGTFIHKQHVIADVASCPRCPSMTCTLCKGAAHDNDCLEDKALQQTLKFMEETGIRRCASCRAGVELRSGCNHMTCDCKAEFCYVCGATWKTCECAFWYPERLLDRALEVVRRNPQGPQVDAVARMLRRQECAHLVFMMIHRSVFASLDAADGVAKREGKDRSLTESNEPEVYCY